MSDYDSPWKEALDRYFEAFMEFSFPALHSQIDWQRGYDMLDKELQQIMPDAALGRRVVDKLVKVFLTSGQEEWLLIHLEVQSQVEHDFAERMFVYYYRIRDRYNHRVVSIAVLGDDQPDWRPGAFVEEFWGCAATFTFPVIKLMDYASRSEELQASSNPFATVVLAHLKTQETRKEPLERYAWKLRLVRGLYQHGWDAEEIRQLFRFIDWMMELPEALEAQFWEAVVRDAEENQMSFVTTGERIGRKKGLEEGLQRGIELALASKFGPAALELRPEIRALTDVPKLEALFAVIMTTDSLAAFQQKLSQKMDGTTGAGG